MYFWFMVNLDHMIRKRHPHTSFWRRLPGSAGGTGCPLAPSAIGLYPYVVQYTYTHDHWGRPLKTTHSYGNGIQAVLHDNVYDGIGRLVADERCGTLSLPTSYTYNVRSWLTGIQSDLFCEVMSYEAPGTDITSRWGGNISQIVCRSGAETNSRKYAFTYDGYGRLAGAAYSGSRAGDYSTSYAYDANSNLTSITRMAIDGLSGGGAFIPGGIGYILSGNQVALRLQGSSGFNAMAMTANASGVDFRQVYYDACGRMVCDSDRGINKIEYNALYLPSTIEYATDGNSLTGYSYGVQYAADGRKLRTGRLDQAMKRLQNATVTDYPEEEELVSVELESLIPSGERIPVLRFESPTDYVGNLVYKDGVLEKILIDGGFITAADGRYHFFVTDHLGNVRVVVNDAGVIEQVNQFYPYGESIELDPASANPGVETITENPYKWGGKEWDEEQGAYDFGARMYSASDARWTTMDPLCEKYYSISPYAYCAGNPVNLVDPDGQSIWIFSEEERVFIRYKEGELFYANGDKYDGSDGLVWLVSETINALYDLNDSIINDVLSTLEQSELPHAFLFNSAFDDGVLADGDYGESLANEGKPVGSWIKLSLKQRKTDDVHSSYITTVGHELSHAYDFDQGLMKGIRPWGQHPSKDPTEIRAVNFENRVRYKTNKPLRHEYGGKRIDAGLWKNPNN